MIYKIARSIAKPIFKYLTHADIYGALNIPKSGKVILASNHIAAIDSAALAIGCPRQIHFIGKKEYFTGSGLKGKGVKLFMKGIGVIPVDRSGGKASENAIKAGLGVLESDGVFGIYPEGTRSPDGVLYKGHTGAARLALLTGAPIIPVGVTGTDKMQPIGKIMPRKSKVIVKIGKPIKVKKTVKEKITYKMLRDLTDSVMKQIAILTQQKMNKNVYGAERKKELKNLLQK